MYPDDRYYSQEHEWIEPVEDGEFVLGITLFAQEELGDVVFVELPEVGSQCDADSEIGTIESVKAVAELFAPLAGTITAINEEVLDRPELLNEDPHGEGWLVRFLPDDEDAHQDLMSADEYREFIGDTSDDEIDEVDPDRDTRRATASVDVVDDLDDSAVDDDLDDDADDDLDDDDLDDDLDSDAGDDDEI